MKIKFTFFLIFSFIFFHSYSQISGNWTLVGPNLFPTNVSGQINGIGRVCQFKFHPSDPQTMYAASASGGLWISTNNAQSWQKLGTDFLPHTACASVCIDYTNDSIIYLGTGDPNYYGNGIGIWKTTDKGATWNIANTGYGFRLAVEILMSPFNNEELIVATNSGILKTYDGGLNWTLKLSTGDFKDMRFKAVANTSIIFAVTSSQLWRSDDMGETWSQVTNGVVIPGGGSGQGFRLAVSTADSNVVYVGMIKDEGTILKSVDGGVSFTTVYHNPAQSLVGYDINGGGQGNYNFSMCCDPTNADIVYVVAHVVWKSVDGGVTWTQLTDWWANLHTDMHDIEVNPYNTNQVFNGNDGGVWLSTDGGDNWVQKSDGLGATEIYHAGTSPTRKDMISIGTQDNGELYFSNTSWKTNRGGDWGSRATFDQLNNTMVYYHENGKRRNLLGGPEANYGLPFTSSNTTVFDFPPTQTGVAFAQNQNVYRTDNLYATVPYWFPISSFNLQAKAMCSHPADPNLLYVVTTNNQLYRSDDALNQITTPAFVNNSVPAGSVASIAPIANNINVVYLSSGSRVYRSDDKGVTWTNVSYNLPTVNIIRIIHDAYSTDESVYVGTAKGVYYKNNSMVSWLNYSNGLPTIADITDFMIYNDGTSASVLRVSYYGRGVWESPLNTTQLPVASFSSSQNILCAGTAVQFTDLSSGSPFAWQWNFPGGSPSSSTQQNPLITYSTPGVYSVTLTVTNITGTNTIVQNSFINVTVPQALPLAEGFQGGGFVPANWQNVDDGNDNITWIKDNANGGYGLSTSSTIFNNFDYDVNGLHDALHTPKYNFTGLTSAQLTFDVAYARYDGSYMDTLAVLISTDCGITFTEEYVKGGTMLATAPDNTNYFVPSASEWRTDTVDLGAYINQPDVMVAFQNRGHYGNVLYLDNINISSASSSAPVAGFYASAVSVCAASAVTFTDLSSSLPSSWNWTFAGGSPGGSSLQNPVITYNTPGSYDVTLVVSNANGSDSLTLVNYITVLAPPAAPVISQNQNTLSSTPGVTYQWYLNGVLIPGAGNQTFNATTDGNYTVMITDSNGCSALSLSFPFIFNAVIENATNENSLSVFPNPVHDMLNIYFNSGTERQDFVLEIKNLLGQTVYSEKVKSLNREWNTHINISEFAEGMYLVLITGENKISGRKILVY